jgi:hypothetical protein
MKLSSHRAFHHLLVGGIVATLTGSVALLAEDTGWRQPGVRAWYIGATGAGVNSEEANLIEQAGAGIRVVRHSSVAYWSTPSPASVLPVPNPASEGPFWISPARLRALHQLDAISWQGLSLIVKARVTYQNADDLPFFAYLPVQALYQAQSPRELITLTGDNDGVVGDYFFDVETGLGLSSSLYMPGFYIMMMLSEINYDFAAHQAFAEDNGPHTGYRAGQGAGRMEWPVSQFYLFEERVISRYGPSVRADLTLSLQNISSGQAFTDNYTSLFDGADRQFYITPIGLTVAATVAAATTWTTNGTHGFFWVPAGDLTRSSIRVWDLDLTLRSPVGNDTVFASELPPATGNGIWGFTRLQLDPDGFVQEMTVQSPWMSFNVDSSVALAASKTNYITGRAYYEGTMGAAIPACAVTLEPDHRAHPATADAGTFTVTTSGTCSWSAGSADGWLHTTSSGTGPGVVSYQVDANPGTPRTGTLTVGSQTFTVTQTGEISVGTLTVVSLKMAMKFPPGKMDSATLKAQFTPPGNFSAGGVPATLNLGGVQMTFPLDAKGKGASGKSKLTIKIKNGTAAVTATLKGDWNSDWAAVGLTDETVTSKSVTIPIELEFAGSAPVAFAAQKGLVYRATAGKSGQAR